MLIAGSNRMTAQKPKSVHISVHLPEASYARIRAMAAADDVPTARPVRHAPLKFLSERDGQVELPLGR